MTQKVTMHDPKSVTTKRSIEYRMHIPNTQYLTLSTMSCANVHARDVCVCIAMHFQKALPLRGQSNTNEYPIPNTCLCQHGQACMHMKYMSALPRMSKKSCHSVASRSLRGQQNIDYAYSVSNTSHYLHAPNGPAVWCVALRIRRLWKWNSLIWKRINLFWK